MRARGPAILALLLCLLGSGASSAAAQVLLSDALKLYGEGRYEEARIACLEDLRADPNSIEPYVVISWSLISLGRYADAENYALKGYQLRRDPRLTESLGEAAYFLGRNEEALRHLQNYVSAVAEGGRVGSAYYYMGETYLRLARFAHADIALSAAVEYVPGNARWWTRLGWAREKANDPTHALEAYRKALVIDPRFEDALGGVERVTSRLR